MNISFCVFRWFNLHDKVDAGDIEATSSNISGDQNVELLFLEALEGDFTLVLGDVTMHNFDVFLDLF